LHGGRQHGLVLRRLAEGVRLQRVIVGQDVLTNVRGRPDPLLLEFIVFEIFGSQVGPLFQYYHPKTSGGKFFRNHASRGTRPDDYKVDGRCGFEPGHPWTPKLGYFPFTISAS
jgi:hypothetical protein